MFTIDIFKNVAVDEELKLKGLEFLNKYKKGQFIYPNVIIRNLKLPKNSITWILQALIENGCVEELKFSMCPRCCSSTNSYSIEEYKKLKELYCDICEEEIDLSHYSSIYKIR